MSHTPPIPEDCWRSKRILQLERELAEVNKSCEANRKAYHSAISDCVKLQRELATVTADLEFRRDLGALQQQEYDKVTDERDAWKQSTQDERNIHMTTIEGRDAAQQEVRRLREALEETNARLEEWRFHAESWGTDASSVRKHIKELTAERDALQEHRAKLWDAANLEEKLG